MYEAKMEELRVEILENIKVEEDTKQSVWMHFFGFLGKWFTSLLSLFYILFKGLWTFAKYTYYRFMAWVDSQDDKD